jgi:hypothetical protein
MPPWGANLHYSIKAMHSFSQQSQMIPRSRPDTLCIVVSLASMIGKVTSNTNKQFPSSTNSNDDQGIATVRRQISDRHTVVVVRPHTADRGNVLTIVDIYLQRQSNPPH